jgi:phosphoribosylanthranilate isomerase
MEDWKIIGPIIAAIVGIYGFVLRHTSKRHVTSEEINRLKDAVQWKDNCEQIVKRVENMITLKTELLDKKLDIVIDLIENGSK